MPETTKNVNKVVYGGKVLIDLTGDTVTPGTLLTGTTAHDKSGAAITGTMEASEVINRPLLGVDHFGGHRSGQRPGAVCGSVS